MMKKIVAVFINFIVYWSISTAIDSKELKTKFNESVAKSYLAALQHLTYQMLGPLPEYPPIGTFSEDIENERDLDALKSNISSFENYLKLFETGLHWFVSVTDKSIKETIEEKSMVKTTLGTIKLNVSLIANTSEELDISTAIDSKELKTKFNESVAKPYLAAMQYFAYEILGPLAENPPIDTFSEDIENDPAELQSKISSFEVQLKSLETGLNLLVNETDTSIEETVAEQSITENKLARIKQSISLIANEIKQLDKQHRLNENKILKIKKRLVSVSKVLAEEKKKREILLKRCFKSHLPRVPCFTINLNAVKLKELQQITSYHMLLNIEKNLQKEKNRMMEEKRDLHTNKLSMELNEKELNMTLDSLHEFQQRVVNASIALKVVLVHISILAGKSKVLKNTVADLIDINVFVLLLQTIGDQIATYTGEQQLDFHPFKDVNDSIIASVKEITENLRQI